MIEQHATLAEKFLKKGIWLYLFSFIIAPIGYIIKIIISGELSVSEVGVLYGVISLITMIAAYNDLGMTQSILYFVPRYITEKKYAKVKSILAYSLIIQTLTGLSIALFFFFGSDLLAHYYFKSEAASEVLRIFAFFFLGINILTIIITFFLSVQNTFLAKITEFIRMSFVLLATVCIFSYDIGSIVHYSYTWLVGLYIGILFGVYVFYTNYHLEYLKNEKVIWSKSLFREIFKYSIVSFVGTQGATILSQIDMQMIIILLGTTDAGYYTNYLTLISIAFMVLIPIFNILTPLFSELEGKKEYDKIKNIKLFFNKYFIVIGFLLSIIFFIYHAHIAYIFFGEKFITSGEILKYSVLFLMFNLLLQMNFHLLGGIGKVKKRAQIIYFAILLNIITNYLLIKTIGVYGAALATGIGWLVIWLLSEQSIEKKYKGKIDTLFLAKNIILFGILGIILHTYFVFPYFDYSKITVFGLISMVGLFLFSIFFILNIKETKILIANIRRK